MVEYYANYLHQIQRKLNRRFDLHGLHHRHLNRFIQDEIGLLLDGAKVLDAGCGMSIWMTQELETKIRYQGVDCQPEAVEFCNKTFPLRQYLISDLSLLPFPDKTFDAVVMREVIEHLAHPAPAVKEVCRVLKDDGRYILTTPNYNNILLFFIENIYNRFFVKDLKPYQDDVHPSKFNHHRLKSLLETYFEKVIPSTVDLGINLAYVCSGVRHVIE